MPVRSGARWRTPAAEQRLSDSIPGARGCLALLGGRGHGLRGGGVGPPSASRRSACAMSNFAVLKEQAFEANRVIVEAGLVVLAFGNASAIDRNAGAVAIKPTGVAYRDLRPDSMVVVDLRSGRVVDGSYRPSTDMPEGAGNPIRP